MITPIHTPPPISLKCNKIYGPHAIMFTTSASNWNFRINGNETQDVHVPVISNYILVHISIKKINGTILAIVLV